MAHKVFICHSSKDKQIADAACAALEAQRIPCWIAPRDILAGEEYGKAIVEALSCCQIVLLIFSHDANDSPQVRREIERAVSKGKIIVPFRIEDVMPSDAMEFALSNTHWLDAITPPMERYLLQLCDSISRLIQKHPEAEPPLWKPQEPAPRPIAEPESVTREAWPSPETATEMPVAPPQSAPDKPTARHEPTLGPAGEEVRVAQPGTYEPAPPTEAPLRTKSKLHWLKSPRALQVGLAALGIVVVAFAALLFKLEYHSMKLARTLPATAQPAVVFSVAFSPDGRTLAAGGEHGSLRLWDPTSGQLLRTLQTQSDDVSSVAFSPDGRTLASGKEDNTIDLWDTASGKLLLTLQGHKDQVESVAFSPDGRTLASGSRDKTIMLWDVASGKLLRTLFRNAVIRSIAFSPDGHTLASGGDDSYIQLFDVTKGEVVRQWRAWESEVMSVAFSPDGRSLASGSADEAQLWDATSGQLLFTLPCETNNSWAGSISVAFSPDGRTLATGSLGHMVLGFDRNVELWNVTNGQLLQTSSIPFDRSRVVYSVAFSPDGRTLASGTGYGAVRLWDVSNVNK